LASSPELPPSGARPSALAGGLLIGGQRNGRPRRKRDRPQNKAMRNDMSITPKSLSNNPPAPAVSAWGGIRIVSPWPCPHCGRALRARDVDVDFGHVRLVCSGCHRDVLTVEASS
jgi:hypothetical protein